MYEVETFLNRLHRQGRLTTDQREQITTFISNVFHANDRRGTTPPRANRSHESSSDSEQTAADEILLPQQVVSLDQMLQLSNRISGEAFYQMMIVILQTLHKLFEQDRLDTIAFIDLATGIQRLVQRAETDEAANERTNTARDLPSEFEFVAGNKICTIFGPLRPPSHSRGYFAGNAFARSLLGCSDLGQCHTPCHLQAGCPYYDLGWFLAAMPKSQQFSEQDVSYVLKWTEAMLKSECGLFSTRRCQCRRLGDDAADSIDSLGQENELEAAQRGHLSVRPAAYTLRDGADTTGKTWDLGPNNQRGRDRLRRNCKLAALRRSAQASKRIKPRSSSR